MTTVAEQKEPKSRKLSPEAQVKLKRSQDKEKKAATKKMSRIKAAVKVIQKIGSKGKAMEDIVAAADEMYVAAGGPSNLKEALWSVRTTIQTMVAMEEITYDHGMVQPAKKESEETKTE